jgi:hypothetical protein
MSTTTHCITMSLADMVVTQSDVTQSICDARRPLLAFALAAALKGLSTSEE